MAPTSPLIGRIELARVGIGRPAPGAVHPMRATAAQALGEAILLMIGSLLLVLIVNALARELTSRYPVGEVLFYRFFGAAWLVALLSGRELARALVTPRLKLHLVRVMFGVSATLALYLATQHLPFADLMAIAYSSPLIVAL